MKDTEYAFAVAKVRANENKLLSETAVENVITASDYSAAVKALADAGFADFSSGDTDKILSQKSKSAFELICDCAPEKSCLDFLIVKNDFHNIKAFLKSMVTRTDCTKYLLFPSLTDYETLKKALEGKQYALLPEFEADSAKHSYDVLMKTMDGQLVDVILDRASLEAQIKLAKDSKDDFAIGLAEHIAATTDIKILLRCIRTGKDKEFMLDAVAECSSVNKDRLIESALEGIDEYSDYVRSSGFASLADSMKTGDVAFEKEIDDLLIDYVKNAKFQSFGIAPLVAFYFASESEIKTVRIILSCKKNGLDIKNIRERVRKLYV